MATITLESIMKGSPGEPEVTVVQPSRRTLAGRDFASFKEGEHVLIFGRARTDSLYELVGGHDGKHRIGDPTTDFVLEQIGHAADAE
jgi:hypothetical protein